MQGYSCLLGGERLSCLGSAGAQLRSSGGEFVGGMKHPGGEVHLLEGLMSGAQLFPRLDALTAAAEAGTIHELRAAVSKVSGASAWAASTAWYACTAVSSSAAESPDIVPPHSGSFTELNTGLDHLGLVATSREELEAWERRFEEHGVSYTPIRDTEMGHHLNFRDPTASPWSSARRPTWR
jgi:hypothetical protein